jgi:hypothetical protein
MELLNSAPDEPAIILDLGALSKSEGVLDIDAEMANGAL